MAMNNTGTAVASVEQEKIRNVVPADLVGQVENVDDVVSDFLTAAVPFEAGEGISVFVDACTGARFCECHISAEKLIGLGTIDVPLDPDDQETTEQTVKS